MMTPDPMPDRSHPITIVLDVLEREAQGDLSGLAAHPGMQGVYRNALKLQQIVRLDARIFHETLLCGAWVVVRYTTHATAIVDYGELVKGETLTGETIGMYLVSEGEIVRQHSQAGMVPDHLS